MCLRRRIRSEGIFPGGLTSKREINGLCKTGIHNLNQWAYCIIAFHHGKMHYCVRESLQLIETGART